MATALRSTPVIREPVWLLMVAPAIWTSHFMACAITATFSCARWSPGAALGSAHLAIALYTAGAVLGIATCLAMGLRARREAPLAWPGHEPDSRQQWLGAAMVVLAVASLVGAMAVAAATWMTPACA